MRYKKQNWKYQYIDKELERYNYYKDKIEELEADIIEASGSHDSNGGRTNKIGRPTETIAIRLDSDAQRKRMKDLVSAVDKVIYSEAQKKEIKDVFELKYKYHIKNKHEICNKAHISVETYYRHKRYIIKSVGLLLGIDIYK